VRGKVENKLLGMPFRGVPALVTTSERIGLALIRLARQGADKPLLENREVNELAAAEAALRVG